MGAHIKKEGWFNWNRPACEKTVRYEEYNSTGPGGQMDQRAGWSRLLTGEEAKKYDIEAILAGEDGWRPY